jgi:hypothetical protein
MARLANVNLDCYAACEELFATARNKKKGKPVRSFATLKKRDDIYELWFRGSLVIEYHPGDKVVFPSALNHIRHEIHTITSSLDTATPFHMMRVGKNKYRIWHRDQPGVWRRRDYGTTHPDWAFVRKHTQEYYPGVSFDLQTGKCLNPRRDASARIVPEKRRDWLRAIKSFKKGVRVRLKLGAFEARFNELTTAAAAATGISRNRFGLAGDDLDYLFDDICEGRFTQRTLDMLTSYYIRSVWFSGLATFKDDRFEQTIDGLLNNCSIDFRTKFGVFDNANA